jgi:hypothetical protein
MADNERNDLNRREFLRKAAITGAVAWAVPVIQSVSATPAFAQTGSPTCCGHSETPSGGCGNCMDACKTACGTAAGCSSLCDPNSVCTFPDNTCPPNRCVATCYSCVNGSPQFNC